MGQARKKTEGGSAGRLAAARRPGRGDDGSSSRSRDKGEKRPAGKRGKKGSSNPIARFAKLVMLLALMAVLGFALVLIADVGKNLIGGVRFGDITFTDLVDKVKDRVLDRDVPEPKKKAPPKTAPKTERPRAAVRTPTTTERAPLQAPSPDDYIRHVEPRVDPEVEQARARLDALLNR